MGGLYTEVQWWNYPAKSINFLTKLVCRSMVLCFCQKETDEVMSPEIMINTSHWIIFQLTVYTLHLTVRSRPAHVSHITHTTDWDLWLKLFKGLIQAQREIRDQWEGKAGWDTVVMARLTCCFVLNNKYLRAGYEDWWGEPIVKLHLVLEHVLTYYYPASIRWY